MSEQRINTVLTEAETIKALKNQLNESEYKLLEKTLKDYANGDDTENPLEIPIDYSGVEEGQHIDYDAMVDRYAKLTIPIKQNVLVPGDPDPVDCLSRYPVFRVIYHIEGTYNLTAELNPVPKEIFRCFYK